MEMEQIEKKLDRETLEEMDAMGEKELHRVIVYSVRSIRETQQELEDNPEYQKLKESMKAITAALKEVKSRQNARIAYAAIRLEELGK